MSDWYNWIQNIALERIDAIERHLNTSPDLFPRFAEAVHRIDAAMEKTDTHPNEELSARDDIWTAYSSALALEMYLAGARDGGRVYHAFVTGELPSIQKHEEEHHEQTDS